MKQRFMASINDLLKRLMQTYFEFDRNMIDAGVTI